MSDLMKVSSNPHIRSKMTTSTIMLCVVLALLPTTVFGVINFGLNALLLIAVTITSSVLFEFIFNKICKKKNSIKDFSAVVTGLLLALNLPPKAPWWIGIIGAFVAIVVIKMLFGGLGQNFMNPALGARCFLLLAFTSIMTDFATDTYTGATPLALLKAGEDVNVFKMLLGFTSGTIGETSFVAIIAGACFLMLLGIIDLRIPGTYIATFVVFIVIFGGQGLNFDYISAHLAGGGLMLGAFFMATDYVTRPITVKGQYVFGIVLGILTGIFRIYGASAEGVSYAIIIGNLLTPLIEKFTMPHGFGYKGGKIR